MTDLDGLGCCLCLLVGPRQPATRKVGDYLVCDEHAPVMRESADIYEAAAKIKREQRKPL